MLLKLDIRKINNIRERLKVNMNTENQHLYFVLLESEIFLKHGMRYCLNTALNSPPKSVTH